MNQQFVGINALIYYSPTLFETMGLDRDMQLIMSGILNMMQLVGVASSVWTMDSAGRRALLLTGSVFMTLAQVVIAILVCLYGEDWPGHRQQGWTSVAFLLFYMLVFGCSWGPVPWAMPSGKSGCYKASCRVASYNVSYRDLPFLSPLQRCGPLNLFELAEQLHHRESIPHLFPSICLIDTFHHCQGLVTPPLVHITGYGAYVFFAIFCALSFVWTFFLVPETKGRSLEQMDDVFGDSTSGEEQSRRQEIETALLRTEREGMLTLVKPCELKPLREEKIILILRGLLMTNALEKILTCRYRDPATHHPRSSRCWEMSINNEISGEARLPVPSK